MKTKLTEKDKKVLVRIAYELAPLKAESFPEFPELSKKEINDSIIVLRKLGLIFLDKDIQLFRTTNKGDELTNSPEFKELEDLFMKNL